MLTVRHPEVLPLVREYPGGLLPIHFHDGSVALVLKLFKEYILAARMRRGFRVYLAPTSFLGRRSFGLVTAFFDDLDEPLTLTTLLFSDDGLTTDISEVLSRECFNVYFFDDQDRELLGYEASNPGFQRFQEAMLAAEFSPFSNGLARIFLQDIPRWFGLRDAADDEAALTVDLVTALFPEDMAVLDVRPEASRYHGAELPMMTQLDRSEPGKFQELDIIGQMQRVFSSSDLYLNPHRSDDGKEFVDVFVATPQNHILIQAKDSPNTEASLGRTITRKKSTTMGHLEKAVGQLRGAISHCQRNEHLRLLTPGLGHKIPTAGRSLCGLIVVKELFDGEQGKYSAPVLSLARETGVPCVVVDYRQFHEITHHLRNEESFIDAIMSIFRTGIERNEFPRLRFGFFGD